MKEIKIDFNSDGKRLDKFLGSYFSECSMGFLFKMLRKKNITLNGKKADGKEKLHEGDTISVFFSDETFNKFANKHVKAAETGNDAQIEEFYKAYNKYQNIDIIYEDDHIILFNKPAGILSQKSDYSDLSVNEYLIGYLLKKGIVTSSSMASFRPSVCNRLDRNTSGIIICSKSLIGAREMTRILRDRSLHKYYKTIVAGDMKTDSTIDGYLYKDEKRNVVKLFNEIPKDNINNESQFSRVKNSYKVLRKGILSDKAGEMKVAELEVLLHTGKTHQIRAHLSSIGHPIIGDVKYGDNRVNQIIKNKTGLKFQLLHAYKLVFPTFTGELSYLSGKVFEAEVPDLYKKIENVLFL